MEQSTNQLGIVEYRQALELLEHFRERVERGEIMSVLIMCEMSDGSMSGGCTATQNVFGIAGLALAWAMRRLGFTSFDDVRAVVSHKIGE